MDAATLKEKINTALAEIYELIPNIVEDVIKSDVKARNDNKPWYNRHRLGVLIESANKAKDVIDENILYSPWFFSELTSYVKTIKIWKSHDTWHEIESSLKDKDHFKHTMLKLLIASHFIDHYDTEVKLVPRGRIKSPDLMIKSQGTGDPHWLYVECYQPSCLSGIEEEITERQLQQVEKRLMDKAKEQFKRYYPGIMALCSYYVSSNTLNKIKNNVRMRLVDTDRPYFGGVLFLNFFIEMLRTSSTTSLTSKYNLDFVNNPSYFGRINIITESQTSTPKINKELPLISRDNLEDYTIISGENNKKPPYYEGEGNLNLLCGGCGKTLAENIWELSLSNVVLHCTYCDSYNLCVKVPDINLGELVSRIAMLNGICYLSKILRINRGIIVIGVKIDDPLINPKIRESIKR